MQQPLLTTIDVDEVGREPLPESLLEATLSFWSRTNSQHWIPVKGRSMLPLLREGDEVLLLHGLRAIRVGDILVFSHAGDLTAHRLLKVSVNEQGRNFYLTRGDNLLKCDTWVCEKEILGRVCAIRRSGSVMDLDTSVWRFINQMVGKCMCGLVNQFGCFGTSSGTASVEHENLSSIILQQVVKICIKGFLKTVIVIFGCWNSSETKPT